MSLVGSRPSFILQTASNIPRSSKAKTMKPRMVPRMIQVTFRWAVTGEPIEHKIRVRPGTKVSELLCNLCAATGRDIEET